MRFQGIFPALTTPFAPDGSVAVDKLRENIARYNRVPLSGYVVNGSTGESVLLSLAEIDRVWNVAREQMRETLVLNCISRVFRFVIRRCDFDFDCEFIELI